MCQLVHNGILYQIHKAISIYYTISKPVLHALKCFASGFFNIFTRRSFALSKGIKTRNVTKDVKAARRMEPHGHNRTNGNTLPLPNTLKIR